MTSGGSGRPVAITGFALPSDRKSDPTSRYQRQEPFAPDTCIYTIDTPTRQSEPPSS